MFDDFWAASRFSPLHQRRLGERLRDFRPQPPLIDPLELPAAPVALPRPDDRLQKLFQARRSTREFAPKPLSGKQLGTVLGALGDNSHPSAGGLHPLRCYAFVHGRAVRYDIRRHALQDIGPAPANLAEIQASSNGTDANGLEPKRKYCLTGEFGEFCGCGWVACTSRTT
mgnify:CR=1 FL=1